MYSALLYIYYKAARPKGGAKNEKYEVMYIVRPNVEEEARKALIEEMNTVLLQKFYGR